MLYRKRIRQRVINLYGGVCACCGESNLLFLTLDHKNNDGAADRKRLSKVGKRGVRNPISSVTFYFDALKNHRDDLQVLCYNCNLGRATNDGVCPHVKPPLLTYDLDEDLRTRSVLNKGCKIEWPEDKTLAEEVGQTSARATARRLGVDTNAVIRRLKRRGLYPVHEKPDILGLLET